MVQNLPPLKNKIEKFLLKNDNAELSKAFLNAKLSMICKCKNVQRKFN